MRDGPMSRAVTAGLVVASLLAGPGTSAGGADQAAAADRGLFRVTLLGTGNPRPTPDRFGPSTLVEAGALRLLVDAGRGTAIRLFQIGEAGLLSGVDAILLTHLHSDHVVGLPDLWLNGWLFGRARPLPVLGPEGTASLAAHLEQAFGFDIHIRRDVEERLPAGGVVLEASDVEPGVVFEREGVTVTAFPVEHGEVRPAFGYRIDYGGRSAVFSGDTTRTAALVEAAKGADLVVHEVISPEVERRRAQVDPAVIDGIIARHTIPEDAGRIFAQIAPRLAVYSHIVPSPATPADLIPPTRKTYDGPLEVGHDLMSITIGDRIDVGTRTSASR